MFNTLASYLLGTSNQQPTGGVEERNIRLTSVVADDDWVLVDQDSEGNSEVESSVSDSLDGYDDLNSCHKQLPHILTRSSSASSLRCATMEDSWFVTPPPCFTSAGPVHMETSPLENLLIEHPSMSVYQHPHSALIGPRYNSVAVQAANESEFSDEDELEEIVEQVPVPVQRLAVETYRERQLHVPRRNSVNILQQQEKQWKQTKQAQKVQLRKACQSLKRKYLDRANKAREVNTRNRHQRRSERSQGANRSYVNNNRKC
ncbi:tumor protein p53-inducible nuclear protein 1 [Photinus pyralis]|uniref:Uncharacterized protein n=1 Tax=Photinus pyralis TaxID=7054 RepID=A0A1Y1LP73_PHOPY|nr:tumor protein p53-inducible nuclear protein 1 [Photinus pyralis]XP_031346219.1 tumor protein p53-inducible nuclear protein 1 [Photinus pyralis]